jgi:hypothetical protein
VQIIAIAIVLAFSTASLVNGAWAAAFSFTLFPLQQLLWSSSPLFLANRTLPNFVVATAVGLGLLRQLLAKGASLAGVTNPVSLASLGLYAWAAISLIWTRAPESGTEIVVQGLPYVLLMIIVVPIMVGSLDEVAALRSALLWMGTTVLCAIAVSPDFTYWSGRLVFQFSAETRTNPLALGELGGLVLLAAVLQPSGHRSLGSSWFRGGAGLVGIIGMLQSGSRGQLLGAIAICVAAIPIARPILNLRRLFGYGVGVAILVAVVLIVAQFVLEVDALQRWDRNEMQEASSGRLNNILEIASVWYATPSAWLFGLGANAFPAVVSEASQGYTHNLTVELICEYGLIGFVIFCVALGLALSCSRWMFDRVRNDPERRASLGFLVAAAMFEIFLVQKQGNLWADVALFCILCMIARIRHAWPTTEVDGDDMGPSGASAIAVR